MMSVIKKYPLTQNRCYKENRPLNPIGFMIHSTGAQNKTLKRYIFPDDGLIGVNQYNNHWNQASINGKPLNLLVHGFIGEDKNGVVRAYETCPPNRVAWHCGGNGNKNLIGYEICEGSPTDIDYFNKVWDLSTKVVAEYCVMYNWSINKVISHKEGNRIGIASAHSDPESYFKNFGKTMRDFRLAVQVEIDNLKAQ